MREVITSLRHLDTPLIARGTGIFGMNFRNMPPLEWGWGFGGTLVAMVAIGVAMVFYFRSRRWLRVEIQSSERTVARVRFTAPRSCLA